MPYPTEHAARIRQPGEFEQGSFRRVNNKYGPGIHVIFGRLKGKTTMDVQAIRFAKAKWTAERAQAWLKDNGYKPVSFEPASSGDAAKEKKYSEAMAEGVFSFKEVPAGALCFAADELAVSDANGPDAKSAPLRMKARSGQPIEHWYWGKIAHDLSGMRMKAGRVAVDYNHDPKEVIGYLNHFDISSGDLHCSGALVPYKENDRATEVAHKARNGVPYEASIFFGGGDTVVEEVPQGECAEVNGYKFDGPGVIFREWPLRGVALCPYGADMNTESALSETTCIVRVAGAALQENETEQEKELDMSKTAEAAAAAAVEAKPEEKGKELAAVETGAAAAAPVVEKPGKRFLEAFGDKGGVWFAEGLSFEQAQERYVGDLKAERDALTKECAELKTKLAAVATAGAAAPVAPSAPAPEAPAPGKAFMALAEEKVAAAKAAGKRLSMSDAIREVAKENPEAYAKHRKGGKA